MYVVPRCAGNSEPFDVLIERQSGPGYRVALKAARDLCNDCPLKPTCWVENREEAWVAAVSGVDTRKPTVHRRTCGTGTGYSTHVNRREKPCDECKAQHARERQAKRLALVLAETQDYDVLKAAHSAYERLRKTGGNIPEKMRAWESAYQRVSHLRSKGVA